MNPRPYRRRPRKAFTLIEAMAAIAIIALLATIGVLAYEKVSKSTASTATGVSLATANNILQEYNTAVGIKNLGTDMDPGAFPYPGGKRGMYNGASAGPNDPIGYGTTCPSADLQLINTRMVMAIFSRLPGVAKIIASVPSKMQLPPDPSSATPNAIVLLDAWSHPLVFVPAGGLVTQVKTGKANGDGTPAYQTILVRTSGILTGSTTPQFTSPTNPPPIGPNDRPFWASPGPDGDLSLGDDNVYSFQQQ